MNKNLIIVIVLIVLVVLAVAQAVKLSVDGKASTASGKTSTQSSGQQNTNADLPPSLQSSSGMVGGC